MIFYRLVGDYNKTLVVTTVKATPFPYSLGLIFWDQILFHSSSSTLDVLCSSLRRLPELTENLQVFLSTNKLESSHFCPVLNYHVRLEHRYLFTGVLSHGFPSLYLHFSSTISLSSIAMSQHRHSSAQLGEVRIMENWRRSSGVQSSAIWSLQANTETILF